MTLVAFLSRRRRVIVLCTATVALHFVTIDWLGSRLGAEPTTALKPSVATVRLPPVEHSSAPPPDIAPIAPAPAPPKPRKKAMPLPKPDATAALPAESGALSDPMAGVEQAVAALPPPQIEPEPAAAPATAQADAPPKEQAEQVSTRRYKVNLPPSASFDMDLTRTDAKGAKWTASGKMTWQTDGSKYKVVMEAGLAMLVARVSLLELVSEGGIDDAGIAPETFTEKRRSRSQTATHFQRNEGRITFSASESSYPLLPGAQDRASVPFQLAAIGRANVNQFGGDVDIQVGDNRDATIYRFQLIGEEEIDTKMGRIVTLHLSRPPKPGSYSARLDIWLAPSLQWFPVQIRNTEANGALTTQTVTNIAMNNASSHE